MLTTKINQNYLFSMDNCFVKASKSYKNIKNLPQEFLWILTQNFTQSYPEPLTLAVSTICRVRRQKRKTTKFCKKCIFLKDNFEKFAQMSRMAINEAYLCTSFMIFLQADKVLLITYFY
jgi:hypothetical protein